MPAPPFSCRSVILENEDSGEGLISVEDSIKLEREGFVFFRKEIEESLLKEAVTEGKPKVVNAEIVEERKDRH